MVPNILPKKNLTSTVPCKENIQDSGKILEDKFGAEQRGLYENSFLKEEKMDMTMTHE